MKKIPKPIACNQNWLDMKSMPGGRLCGECQKKIVDFSHMTWKEIEKMQVENNASLCGMYKPKQLTYWGQEIPTPVYKKKITVIGFLLSLFFSTSSFSQETKPKEKTVICGTTIGKTTKGEIEYLPSVSITIPNTTIYTVSNMDGYYELDLTDYIDTISSSNIIFSFVGYQAHVAPINTFLKNKNNEYDVELIEEEREMITFYVERPTRIKRITRKVKRLFIKY